MSGTVPTADVDVSVGEPSIPEGPDASLDVDKPKRKSSFFGSFLPGRKKDKKESGMPPQTLAAPFSFLQRAVITVVQELTQFENIEEDLNW